MAFKSRKQKQDPWGFSMGVGISLKIWLPSIKCDLKSQPLKSNSFYIWLTPSIRIRAKNMKDGGNTRMKGIVKWFDSDKGYGFITAENGKDLFAHFSQIQAEGYKSLNEGDQVTFDVVQSDRGEQASNIKVV
jgi:cold shock protein